MNSLKFNIKKLSVLQYMILEHVEVLQQYGKDKPIVVDDTEWDVMKVQLLNSDCANSQIRVVARSTDSIGKYYKFFDEKHTDAINAFPDALGINTAIRNEYSTIAEIVKSQLRGMFVYHQNNPNTKYVIISVMIDVNFDINLVVDNEDSPAFYVNLLGNSKWKLLYD